MPFSILIVIIDAAAGKHEEEEPLLRTRVTIFVVFVVRVILTIDRRSPRSVVPIRTRFVFPRFNALFFLSVFVEDAFFASLIFGLVLGLFYQ